MKKSMDSRFLKKILTDEEIEIVNLAQNTDTALWSLWACKEAAYKVIKKSCNDDNFTPRRWSVNVKLQSTKHPSSYRKGYVTIPGRDVVYVRLFSHPSYVHCIGADSLSALDHLSWGIDILPLREDGQSDNPSSFVRQCLASGLARFLNLNSGEITIKRIKKGALLQPPEVYIGGKRAAMDISLSHDGRFIAYAFNETR